MSNKIAVIGGGVSGLVAAYELEKQGVGEIVLYDSTSQLGGMIGSERIGDYLVENSADMFTTRPSAALDLVCELGRESELIRTEPIEDRVFLGVGDTIHAVPSGFSLMQPTLQYPVLSSGLLDWETKVRFFRERFIEEPKLVADESLTEFASRRFGSEVFSRLVQPLAAGIYTADPDLLSMRATMERFQQQVAESGSLIAAGEKVQEEGPASGARYDLFRAPRDGMGKLIEWIVSSLERTEIKTHCEIEELTRNGQCWQLKHSTGVDEFDGVLFAAPTRVGARLFRNSHPVLAQHLKRMKTASSALIVAGIRKDQLKRPFSGFGLLFPARESRPFIALSFSSNKFAGRAPENAHLVRGFAGGALNPELLEHSDEELMTLFARELHRWFGFTGKLEFFRIHRWYDCMPQYHIGHLDWLERLEAHVRELPNFELTGNSYHGVGIPACIESARKAARIIATVSAEPGRLDDPTTSKIRT